MDISPTSRTSLRKTAERRSFQSNTCIVEWNNAPVSLIRCPYLISRLITVGYSSTLIAGPINSEKADCSSEQSSSSFAQLSVCRLILLFVFCPTRGNTAAAAAAESARTLLSSLRDFTYGSPRLHVSQQYRPARYKGCLSLFPHRPILPIITGKP